MTPVLLALALAAADPCAAVDTRVPLDPESAIAYRRVGDAERAAGSLETAAVAYGEAVARDPEDATSRAALGEICRERGESEPFRRGLVLMEAGDLRGAVAAFREARASGPDASAALVEGVCDYELGDHGEARERLREAREDPTHRELADLYLGLIALDDGDGVEAARLLDAAAAGPGVAPIASDLARLARRTGKLVMSVLAESGWDSNAQLAPSGTPVGTSSDGALGVTLTALFRPSGESGPYLRAGGTYHQQLRFGDLDQGALSGAMGWQLGRGSRAAIAEYAFDERILGGSSFLTAHRLLAGGWIPAGGLSLGASYFARFESYHGSLYQPFSGTLHRLEATASAPVGRAGHFTLGYRLVRDVTDRSELSFLEHGPHAELRVDLVPRVHATLDASAAWRAHDAVDPLLTVLRSDTYLDAAAALEWDVADHVVLRASLDARKAWSSSAAFAYTRLAPVLGVAWVAGL